MVIRNMSVSQKEATNDEKEKEMFLSYLSKYLDEKDANFLLSSKEYRKVIYNFIFWFEESDFLKMNQNDRPLVASQKISIEVVMLIALVHSIENSHTEGVIHSFFEKLGIEEKFLLNWIVEMEEPISIEELINKKQEYKNYWTNKERDRKKQRRELINILIDNNKSVINSSFKERIKYLFALRSQIVHEGSMCLSAKFTSPSPKFLISTITEEYPSKHVNKKVLHFANCKDSFDSILKELFFSALLKKARPNRNNISPKIKANLEYIVRNLERNNYDIIDYQTREKLREKIENL